MASAADLKAEGNEHFRKDSFDEALAAYTKALELDPSEASIHRCRPFTPITRPHASRARIAWRPPALCYTASHANFIPFTRTRACSHVRPRKMVILGCESIAPTVARVFCTPGHHRHDSTGGQNGRWAERAPSATRRVPRGLGSDRGLRMVPTSGAQYWMRRLQALYGHPCTGLAPATSVPGRSQPITHHPRRRSYCRAATCRRATRAKRTGRVRSPRRWQSSSSSPIGRRHRCNQRTT